VPVGHPPGLSSDWVSISPEPTYPWHIRAMPIEIVDCRARGGFSWDANPEKIIFKTESGTYIGSRFTCKASEIPSQIRDAIKKGSKVKAEVGPEPDADGLGLIPFVGFPV